MKTLDKLLFIIIIFGLFSCDLGNNPNHNTVEPKRKCTCDLEPFYSQMTKESTDSIIQNDLSFGAEVEVKIDEIISAKGSIKDGKQKTSVTKVLSEIENEFPAEFNKEIFNFQIKQKIYCASYLAYCNNNSISDEEFNSLTIELLSELSKSNIAQPKPTTDNPSPIYSVVNDVSPNADFTIGIGKANIREHPLLINDGKVIGEAKFKEELEYLDFRTQEVEEIKIGDKIYKECWYKIKVDTVEGWIYGGCLLNAQTLNPKGNINAEHKIYLSKKNKFHITISDKIKHRKMEKFPKGMINESQNSGTVSMRICMNKNGKIMSQGFDKEKSNISESNALTDFTKEFLNKVIFEKNDSANKECGQITFYFN